MVRLSDSRKGTDIFAVFCDGDDEIGDLAAVQLDGLGKRFVASSERLVTRYQCFYPFLEVHSVFSIVVAPGGKGLSPDECGLDGGAKSVQSFAAGGETRVLIGLAR